MKSVIEIVQQQYHRTFRAHQLCEQGKNDQGSFTRAFGRNVISSDEIEEKRVGHNGFRFGVADLLTIDLNVLQFGVGN